MNHPLSAKNAPMIIVHKHNDIGTPIITPRKNFMIAFSSSLHAYDTKSFDSRRPLAMALCFQSPSAPWLRAAFPVLLLWFALIPFG